MNGVQVEFSVSLVKQLGSSERSRGRIGPSCCHRSPQKVRAQGKPGDLTHPQPHVRK